MQSPQIYLLALITLVCCGCNSSGSSTELDGVDQQSKHDGPASVTSPQPIDRNVGVEHDIVVEFRGRDVRLENSIATPGRRGDAYRDPSTGEIAWPALTCKNSDCAAAQSNDRPYVFVRAIPGSDINDEGYVIAGRKVTEDDVSPPCPHCGRADTVSAYESPDVQRRRQELLEELRIARDPASSHSDTATRAPVEILRELAQLPRVYLLP